MSEAFNLYLPVASSALLLCLCGTSLTAQSTYLGFDRNDYPGDGNMGILKRSFAFTGYWLNNPPGANANTWKAHRVSLQQMGYGFLLLFNGREYNAIKASGDAATLGKRDAQDAVDAAQKEGFPKRSIIFLDQEQGGRMLPEQRAYIHAFVDGLARGGYRAGIYCSGIPFRESAGVSVVTANDIRDHAQGREIHFFISDDQCPPAKGCVLADPAPRPAASGVSFAEVWQYAQSPRRPDITTACRKTYAADGNCYPPGFAPITGMHIDVESSNSADPSAARTR
jgi:hypothetical protein